MSPAEVGNLCVLHTKVVPAGFVPALDNVAKSTTGVGQGLLAVVGVIFGAVVPAKQVGVQVVIVTTTESAGL